MWLPHTELCHEKPDGIEAPRSSCLRTISSANRTPYTAAQQKSFAVSQASLSLAMNLLFGQHTNCLGILFLDCLFPTPHPSYITARVVCQWLWQDTSQTSSHTWWYPLSLWIFFHCEYLSADIELGGKGGYTDDWHHCLRNLCPSEETAMLSKG